MLARRIRSFPEGQHTASPPPRLLHELTDEQIVVATRAVKAVAAEAPPLSGNRTYALLAWTVADARGAAVPLDRPLALTVGKRLDRGCLQGVTHCTHPSFHAGADVVVGGIISAA